MILTLCFQYIFIITFKFMNKNTTLSLVITINSETNVKRIYKTIKLLFLASNDDILWNNNVNLLNMFVFYYLNDNDNYTVDMINNNTFNLLTDINNIQAHIVNECILPFIEVIVVINHDDYDEIIYNLKELFDVLSFSNYKLYATDNSFKHHNQKTLGLMSSTNEYVMFIEEYMYKNINHIYSTLADNVLHDADVIMFNYSTIQKDNINIDNTNFFEVSNKFFKRTSISFPFMISSMSTKLSDKLFVAVNNFNINELNMVSYSLYIDEQNNKQTNDDDLYFQSYIPAMIHENKNIFNDEKIFTMLLVNVLTFATNFNLRFSCGNIHCVPSHINEILNKLYIAWNAIYKTLYNESLPILNESQLYISKHLMRLVDYSLFSFTRNYEKNLVNKVLYDIQEEFKKNTVLNDIDKLTFFNKDINVLDFNSLYDGVNIKYSVMTSNDIAQSIIYDVTAPMCID